MSGQWTEVNFDADKPATESDIEIVEAVVEDVEQDAPLPQTKPAVSTAEDNGDDDSVEDSGEGERRPLTRQQRLKMARDRERQRANEAERRAHELAERVKELEKTQESAKADGYDFYIQTLDGNLTALRQQFEAAWASGDGGKVAEIQQKISETAAEKRLMEAERRRMGSPTKAAPQSGGDAPQPTPPTPQPRPVDPTVKALAEDWYSRNKEWFDTDDVMRVYAQHIDSALAREGSDVADPEHWDQLDKRIRAKFPDRFAPKRAQQPVLKAGTTSPAAQGKIKVTLTREDRALAEKMGVPIEVYAREKAKREIAGRNSDYVEI